MAKKMTQNEMVLEILQTEGCITTYQAYEELGCTRLPARIKDLRNDGINIGHVNCIKNNRFGVKVGFVIYYLKNFDTNGRSGFSIAWARKKRLELS